MKKTENKESQKIKIKLGGMTCASCALKIETKLKGLDGVGSSVVNFANEEATVEYRPDITGYSTFNRKHHRNQRNPDMGSRIIV